MKCGTLFNKHQFGKWEEIGRGNLMGKDQLGKRSTIGFWLRQQRKCNKCGYVEVNLQEKY